jgi:biotin carboxylase
VARRLTDKFAQRQALQDGGVAVPGFQAVPPEHDQEPWNTFVAGARFPAVLKPRIDNEGSRDTVRVATLDELRAQAANTNGTELVLEEYLGDRRGGVRECFADYVSVESVVSHGLISHIAVTGRFPPAEPFRESGFFIEAELSPADRRAALETATAALKALAIETGCCHTEIKFTPEGARVIEVNGRIGGGVPEMLSDITDMELLKVAMRIALGEEIEYERPLMPERVGFLFYVHAPSWMRRVTAVEGLEQLCADARVTGGILNRGPEQAVDWREGNHGHVFSLRGTVADHDELEEIDRRVHTEVQIDGE